MRKRRCLLFVVTALLGCAVVVLPAAAGSETAPTIEAVNSSGRYSEQIHYWQPLQATIGLGASVTISNPTVVAHGVHWVGGPAIPACGAGVPVGTSAAASAAGWSGACTFTKPGVYVFYCTVHGPEMTGRIIVGEAATTTTTTTTPTANAEAPGSAPSVAPSTVGARPPAPGAPVAAPLTAGALTLAAGPHARSIRLLLEIPAAAAGGRLEVDLLVARAGLASAGSSPLVRVGRLLRSRLHAGQVSFDVGLDARALRALRVHHRLALTVRVLLHSPRGASASLTRRLLLRR